MNELSELYQEIILDHNKNPKNFGTLDHPTQRAKGHNPLCGDHIEIELEIHDNRVRNISFHGEGCALSKASASMMTTAVKGKTVTEAQDLFLRFQTFVTKDTKEEMEKEELKTLSIFKHVKKFPMRIKCVTLAWHALKAALFLNKKEVTTE